MLSEGQTLKNDPVGRWYKLNFNFGYDESRIQSLKTVNLAYVGEKVLQQKLAAVSSYQLQSQF